MSGEFESVHFEQVLLVTDGEVYPQDEAEMQAGVPLEGGWKFVALLNQKEVARFGGKVQGGEVRCHLEAVIEALRWAIGAGHKHAAVVSKNDYIVKGVGRWLQDWVRRDWRTANGNPVANKDLWEQILALKRQIQVVAVPYQDSRGDQT